MRGMSDAARPSSERVRRYLLGLQDDICTGLGELEPRASFAEQRLEDERGGLSRPRVLAGGDVIEKAAVHFTHSRGSQLPAAATERRPELAGRGFEALSVSLIVHPRNPYAPTSHANVRFFLASAEGADPVWWFGGGFDMTPYYGFEEDCIHWHKTAKAACDPFGPDLYARLKKACDEYFFLPHRQEPRGIGGLFYDDYAEGGFEHSFALMQSVGDHYLKAYLPILRRRHDAPYGERERTFQLVRRGRYVEFNLIYDRGTKYGLQSGRRVESVLASLPPLVRFDYEFTAEPGSPEAQLVDDFLRPRDWLARAE